MTHTSWTPEMTAQALRSWAEYQSKHEIADRMGQAVGIDPIDGRVWFGSSAIEVVRNRDADGVDTPLYLLRVGSDYYLRKVGRRRSREWMATGLPFDLGERPGGMLTSS